MKQEHEMTPGVLVSGEVLSAGDARARVAVLEAENAELRKRVCVPDYLHDKSALADRLYAAGWRDTADAQHSGVESLRLELIAASPAPVERVEQEPVAIWDDMTKLARATSNEPIPHGAHLFTTPQPAPTACTGKNCGSTDPNLHSAECFAEHEQAIAPTAAPPVPKVTSAMKAEFIGEFFWDEEAPYYDEDGELHDDHVAQRVVPWDLCKRIYKEMAGFALANGALTPTAAQDNWISVAERMPPAGTKVLAFYRNSMGVSRRICAEYIGKHQRDAFDFDSDYGDTDYDEASDQYYWPEGWYERVDNWDELTHLAVTEGEITHWRVMPAVPGLDAHQSGGVKV